MAEDAAGLARLILQHRDDAAAHAAARAGAALLRPDHLESAMLDALAAACGLNVDWALPG